MSYIAKSVLMISIQIVPDPNVGWHFKSCFRMFHRFIPQCFSHSSINTFYPRALLLITVLSNFRFVHISKKNYFHIFPTSGDVGFVHIVQTVRRSLHVHLFHVFKLIYIFQLVHIDHILTFENLTPVYLLSPKTCVIFSPEMFCASFVKELCRVISLKGEVFFSSKFEEFSIGMNIPQ